MFNRIKQFILDVRSEFKRVQWPTREATIKSTFVVLGVSLVMALFLGIVDRGLNLVMTLLLSS